MGEQTGISWCHHTFNPWIGCTKVSPACDGCYAEAMMGEAGRYRRVVWGKPGAGAGTRSRTSPANWKQPLKWDRAAAVDGEPRFVFCASLADVFDNEVAAEWRFDLFELIDATPHLTWLLLTKRPQNIVKMAERMDLLNPMGGGWPSNAAIGTTVEDQVRADQNIPALLAAKAALKPAFAFLSMEPLLGPVNIEPWLNPEETCFGCDDGQEGASNRCARRDLPRHEQCPKNRAVITVTEGERDADGVPEWVACTYESVDWIITGGETDQGPHKARPTHPDWLRAIRDQCAAAGVPYHHKQNGEWLYAPHIIAAEGSLVHRWPDGKYSDRIGKKRSGRLLDGVLHYAMPAVRA